MKNLYEIWKELPSEERINFTIRNPRYEIIYKGKGVRKYPFLRQAIQYKLKHDSALFNTFVDIVDTWTGECMNT